jgi:hypothetical protein
MGDYIFTVLQLLSITNDFSIQISVIHAIFHHKLQTREGKLFGQWMNSTIINDNIRSLIHRKCHLR